MPETARRVGRRRRGPFVPAQVVLDLLVERVPEGEMYEALQLAQVSPKLPKLIRSGEVVDLTIEQADRIIVCVLGDNGLWHRVPELRAVYDLPWD